MPRQREYKDSADKQAAYRLRVQEQREEERNLSERAKSILEVAASRGQVLRVDLPLWAQLDELAEWLRSH